MILSKNIYTNPDFSDKFPSSSTGFDLPEKVLQFGTGVLLRALPDYFIDKANKQNRFNGRIVVVKSTWKGDLTDFAAQDNLYTICIRGIENAEVVESDVLSSAISRVLAANEDWDQILSFASSSFLKLIVSNTTEVGLVLLKEPIMGCVPKSYPGKLLAVLHERFKILGNDAGKLIVIATELIPDNGKVLHSIVIELAEHNGLETTFMTWLEEHVSFCNSLVDRIVPGKPEPHILNKIEQDLGYTDNLMVMAEPYCLWAIEGDETVADHLDLLGIDNGLIVKPDIEVYRELKVRLLNGTHTLVCGIAILTGIETVTAAMADDAIAGYLKKVMKEEIIPAIPYPVDIVEAENFANAVLDRFANPYIKHQWINISFQYTMKLRIRVVPVILKYFSRFGVVPQHIAFGFAAYLKFMIAEQADGINYTITDDHATYIKALDQDDFVHSVLSDQTLWGVDLSTLDGFELAVDQYFNYITKNGLRAGLALIQ
jgi:tagaturonate reductase